MNENRTLTILSQLEVVARSLAKKWGQSHAWQDIYSDMCCAFVTKERHLFNKPLTYIVKTCKNEAINRHLKGKSICSKHRNDVEIVSIESLSERIPTERIMEEEVHTKIVIERILASLTVRERQVAMLMFDGHTEKEIACRLLVSQQRINRIKKRIRYKASRILNRQGVIS